MKARNIRGAAVIVAAGLGIAANGCVSGQAERPAFERMRTTEIYSIRYDLPTQHLTVVTRTGDVLEFENVAPAIVDGLRTAKDQDAYFREQIRGRLPFKAMEFPAPVPPAAPNATPTPP